MNFKRLALATTAGLVFGGALYQEVKAQDDARTSELAHQFGQEVSDVVRDNKLAKLREKLNTALEGIPINMIVIGDASGSYAIDARRKNTDKFGKVMEHLQPNKDYLQAYMLGLPPSQPDNPTAFGHEEEILTRTGGNHSYDEGVREEVLRKLTIRYGNLSGPHSDNLAVLRDIRENMVRVADKQIPVLVFFWDGEPNSLDDIDWEARYPDLAVLPSTYQRIDAHHRKLRE